MDKLIDFQIEFDYEKVHESSYIPSNDVASTHLQKRDHDIIKSHEMIWQQRATRVTQIESLFTHITDSTTAVSNEYIFHFHGNITIPGIYNSCGFFSLFVYSFSVGFFLSHAALIDTDNEGLLKAIEGIVWIYAWYTSDVSMSGLAMLMSASYISPNIIVSARHGVNPKICAYKNTQHCSKF